MKPGPHDPRARVPQGCYSRPHLRVAESAGGGDGIPTSALCVPHVPSFLSLTPILRMSRGNADVGCGSWDRPCLRSPSRAGGVPAPRLRWSGEKVNPAGCVARLPGFMAPPPSSVTSEKDLMLELNCFLICKMEATGRPTS